MRCPGVFDQFLMVNTLKYVTAGISWTPEINVFITAGTTPENRSTVGDEGRYVKFRGAASLSLPNGTRYVLPL